MATISYAADRAGGMYNHSSGVVETDGSGATMSAAIELNIDKAKVTSKADILEALDRIKKTVLESVVLTGA